MPPATTLLSLSDDILCRLFARRILRGRSVCRALREALAKSGSETEPVLLHIVAPVDNWSVFLGYAHVTLYVTTDAEMRQCVAAGVRAVRVIGCEDIDNAVELDALKLKPLNKYLWQVAAMIADDDQPLPRVHVIEKLILALNRCQYIRSLVHYWLTRRLLGCVTRHDLFNLGVLLRLMYPPREAHSMLLLHDLSSASALRLLVNNYTSSRYFACTVQTIVHVVAHSADIFVSHRVLESSGCMRALLEVASGWHTARADSRERQNWERDKRHAALMALAYYVRRCTDDSAVASLLDAQIVNIAQAAACSRDYYFALPACVLLSEMSKNDTMCTALFTSNVHDILAWMCRHDIPQAVFVMSQMFYHVQFRCAAVPVSIGDASSRRRFFDVYIDTVHYLRSHARYASYVNYLSYQDPTASDAVARHGYLDFGMI